MMKRFAYSIALLIVTLFSFFIVEVGASSTEETLYISIEEADESAQKYLEIVAENSFDGWKNASLEEAVPLYDFDDNLTSYLYQVKNLDGNDQGYIIVSGFADYEGVIESTRKGSNPYKKIEKGNGIYVGPLLHFEKVNSQEIKDLDANIKVTKSKLKSKGPFNKNEVKKLKSEARVISNEIATSNAVASTGMVAAISDYSYEFISNVPDISWYIGCAPTTGANIIRYWDNDGYSGLIQSSTTNETLIEHLADYMDTNSNGGTDPANFISGIKEYMNDRGYYPTVTSGSAFSFHKNQIDVGNPDKLGTENHPIWGNHAVTGVGYEEYYDTNSFSWKRQVIVHDTWANTAKDYWVSWSSYFSNIVGIEM